jgi:hypothetical protein
MSDVIPSNERTHAIALANRLLDEPNCDPDDDLRVLSRQLLRAVETATPRCTCRRLVHDLCPEHGPICNPEQGTR